MKTKLTLRIEDSLIKRAKEKAKERGQSLSQMVADYFSLIDNSESTEVSDLPPVTASLVGIIDRENVREEDYKRYLEEKHL